MSRVMYGNRRLIPAPLVTVNKSYQTTEDGTKIGSNWSLTIDGTIVAFKGSPSSAGVFWTAGGFPPDEVFEENEKLGSIIRKQEAIRELFSEDGLQLEFQSEDGTQPMKCNPRIISVSFPEGQWFDRCQYTITVEADVLSVNGVPVGEDDFTPYVQSASEQWQIESQDEPQNDAIARTYRLTHSLTAKGKRYYDDAGNLPLQAWEQAKAWVSPRMGLDGDILTNSIISTLPTDGFNHLINETIDEAGGTYSVSETWLLATEPVTETYEVSTNTSNDNGLTTVSIQGTLTGLLSDAASKYQNAQNKFNTVVGLLLTRCQTYSGATLNIVPTTTVVGRNPATGIINYNYTYNDRPSNVIPNAKSEVISVSDTLQTDYPVAIFVLGRTIGPVIQNLNTSKERTRTLTIELVMPIPTGSVADRLTAFPDVGSIVTDCTPAGTITKVQDNSQSWDISSGRFTRTVTWMWEP